MRRPPPKWDGFQIHPIKRSIHGTIVADADELADFFTLYGVMGADLFAIGDYNTREDAEACLISIRMASDNTNLVPNSTATKLTPPSSNSSPELSAKSSK